MGSASTVAHAWHLTDLCSSAAEYFLADTKNIMVRTSKGDLVWIDLDNFETHSRFLILAQIILIFRTIPFVVLQMISLSLVHVNKMTGVGKFTTPLVPVDVI